LNPGLLHVFIGSQTLYNHSARFHKCTEDDVCLVLYVPLWWVGFFFAGRLKGACVKLQWRSGFHLVTEDKVRTDCFFTEYFERNNRIRLVGKNVNKTLTTYTCLKSLALD
jgi:hypothetical protein